MRNLIPVPPLRCIFGLLFLYGFIYSSYIFFILKIKVIIPTVKNYSSWIHSLTMCRAPFTLEVLC